jgi:hypothetical protein
VSKIIKVTSAYSTGSSTRSPPIPAEYQADDYAYIFVNSWVSSRTWTETTSLGYTRIAQVSTSRGSSALFRKKLTGSESTPTFTMSGAANDVGYNLYLIRGLDTTVANVEIDIITANDGSDDVDMPQLDCTGETNSLLVYFITGKQETRKWMFDSRVRQETFDDSDGGAEDAVISSAWTIQQQASAATPAFRAINSEGADSYTIICVALKNDGNNDIPGIVSPESENVTMICPLFFSGSGGGGAFYGGDTVYSSGRLIDPTPVVSNLDDPSTGTATVFQAQNQLGDTGFLQSNSPNPGYATFNTPNLAQWDVPNIMAYKIGPGASETLDLSNSIISVLLKSDNRTQDTFADDGGIWFIPMSGDMTNGAGASYRLATRDSAINPVSGVAPYLMSTASGNYQEHLGGSATAIDFTAITHIAVSARAPGPNKTSFGNAVVLGVLPLTGGSSTYPLSFEDAADHTKKCGTFTVQNQLGQSTSQFYISQDVKIGDGSNTTYWVATGQSGEHPSSYDEDSLFIHPNIPEGAFNIELHASSTCHFDFSNQAFPGGDFHEFKVNSGTALDGSGVFYDFTAIFLFRRNVTLNNIGKTYEKGTISTCKELIKNRADLSSGWIISNCVDTYAVTVASEDELNELRNCTFVNNDYSVRITGNHGGDTWTFTGATVSGGTGSYDIRYEGTGTLTIEADVGSGWSQVRAEATTGTLTISVPTTTFTLNSSESGSDLKIFDTNTQTIESSATGTTVNTTATGTYDWTVQKAGFIPQRGTSVALSTSNVTVDVTLVPDPVYTASHGLTRVTDYDYDESTRILTIVANQEGRDLYSALIDDFISETDFRNCPFPLSAVGPDRIDFNAIGTFNSATTVGATIDSGDIQFWKGAGMEWEHDTTGNPTKKFYSIKSANTLQSGSVVGYTQTNAGTPVESTLVSDKVNEVIQYFEDTNGDGTPDYNYTSHLLFKGFKTGYYQARWDVVNDGGASTLESYEYTINLLQDAIAGTTGDQTITITTLTDHTSSPLVVGTKNFDFELVDPGTNTAENLLAQYNYDIFTAVDTSISGTIYTSYTAFDLPDLIIEAGEDYETEAGYFEQDGLVTDRSGVYLSRSSADHPDILRFQSNDLSYYTPAVLLQTTITNLLTDDTDRRLQIYNVTAASEIYNDVPSATYSDTYTEGSDYTTGDQVRIRWAQANGTTNFKSFSTIVTATASGWSLDASNFIEENTVYATLGIDGSAVTGHTADHADDEVDLTAAANFSGENTQAWLLYILTTSQGIDDFWGGYTIRTGEILIHNATVNMYMDNTTATNIRETANIKIHRDDEAYPVKGGGVTSGGGGIDLRYKDPVYTVATGSAVTEQDKEDIKDKVFAEVIENSETFKDQVKLMRSEAAGKVSVSGTTVNFRDAADTKNRISATVDSNGQRTAITTDTT